MMRRMKIARVTTTTATAAMELLSIRIASKALVSGAIIKLI